MKNADTIVSIRELDKTYKNGFSALKGVNLDIRRGEILALLGPNGAGKTTMIGIVTGLLNATAGTVTVDGLDIVRDARKIRPKIGLVPQELYTDAFETVWATVSFSRGLFGKPANPAYIEKVLRDLSLWDKRNNKILSLSGGMKRRVLIAKALSHEPTILFLDEPTAGVDVELRHDMWRMVRGLRENGVTIILTTHYIEEAEDMADRIAVINHGEIVLVEEKDNLMRQLGKKELHVLLKTPLMFIPPELAVFQLNLADEGKTLIYTYDTQQEQGESGGIAAFLKRLDQLQLEFSDLESRESSLEEIFVNLVKEPS
ncbi:ABC transporter ATP-binding protein [Advenella sp. RU8]|uniref:ABC transporter ATP-binding protein n=1 Tax=Advenella sp. RU8 TaxID=3399575 RepID=UPI003AAB8C5C